MWFKRQNEVTLAALLYDIIDNRYLKIFVFVVIIIFGLLTFPLLIALIFGIPKIYEELLFIWRDEK